MTRNNTVVLMKSTFDVNNLAPSIINTKYKILMSTHCGQI